MSAGLDRPARTRQPSRRIGEAAGDRHEPAKESPIAAAAHTATRQKAPRDPRIEALRLAAALAIAVFHTFMPWFDGLCGAWGLGAFWAENRATSAILGFIDLLGAFGNHVFFLISGMFLIPAAARAAAAAREAAGGEKGGMLEAFWRPQLKACARRAASLLATVALWAACAVALSAVCEPLRETVFAGSGWLVGGLEFIWVYLAFTVAAPAVGLIWSRVSRPRAVAALVCAAALAASAYIAFFSQGEAERGLLDWRKLMSAATYFAAFVAGGALADVRLGRSRAGALLAASVAGSFGVELACSLAGDFDLMAATSFKSTSALSFAMAVAALLFARSLGKKPAAADPSPTSRAACRLAKSILSFYILQSFTAPVWQPAFYEITSEVFYAWSSWVVLAVGCALSACLLAALVALDQLVRLPLFRRLGLA